MRTHTHTESACSLMSTGGFSRKASLAPTQQPKGDFPESQEGQSSRLRPAIEQDNNLTDLSQHREQPVTFSVVLTATFLKAKLFRAVQWKKKSVMCHQQTEALSRCRGWSLCGIQMITWINLGFEDALDEMADCLIERQPAFVGSVMCFWRRHSSSPDTAHKPFLQNPLHKRTIAQHRNT